MQKFYHISYRINLRNNDYVICQKLIAMTPLEYVVHWREIGGHYGDRIILFAEEVTKDQFDKYNILLDQDYDFNQKL